MNSCEDTVGIILEDAINSSAVWNLIAYHPPSAKSYSYDHFPFPILGDNGLRQGKGRYHFDIIAVSGSCLLIVELKCKSSESSEDVEKLRRFTETYSLEKIKAFISTRMSTYSSEMISPITELVTAIGVKYSDIPNIGECGIVQVSGTGNIKWINMPSCSIKSSERLLSLQREI